MTINSVGGVNPVQNYNKVEKSAHTSRINENDSITVSSEARTMGELYAISEYLRDIPDTRTDKVEAAIKKLEDPNYINSDVIENVADKIIDMFGI